MSWLRSAEDYEKLAKRHSARTPEERLINDYAELECTLRKVVTGLAYLLLTWSTVVLLGGFVSLLKLTDFWFLTAISTSFALNLADWYECNYGFPYSALRVYIDTQRLMIHLSASWGSFAVVVFAAVWLTVEACLGILIVAASVVFLILKFSPLVAIVLSLVRLVAHSYGNAGGDTADAAKLKASLQIFYSLALVQNTLFFVWTLFQFYDPLRHMAVRSQCGFGTWATDLLMRYAGETKSICATLGEVPSGRDLVTFAVGLLGSDESPGDRRDAVRMLDRLVVKTPTRQAGLGSKLLPCKAALENLMEALEVGDGRSRERAARVLVALAGDLRHMDQLPTAPHHIASLLEADGDDHQLQFHTTTAAADAPATAAENKQQGTRRRKWLTQGPISWSIRYYFHLNHFVINVNRIIMKFRVLFVVDELERKRTTGPSHPSVPGAVPSLSSIGSRRNFRLYQITRSLHDDDDEEEEDKQDDISASNVLISQGLLIIERLALHQGNRVHICNHHVLLSKLTAPLYSHALLDPAAEYSSEWIDIQGRSLRIVARLMKTPGEASRRLRDGIASNTQAVANLSKILEYQDKHSTAVLRTAAIDILVELVSSSSDGYVTCLDTKKLISQLCDIFLTEVDDNDNNTIEKEEQRKQATKLRHKAGEALAQMLSCSHIFTKHRELPRQDVIEMLRKVLQLILRSPCKTNKLETDVRVMICSPGETNNGTGVGPITNDIGNESSSKKDEEQQQEEELFLVALLSLAVVICDRMVNAHDFTCAAPQDMVSLVNKLKDIIQTNNTATVECLRTVKLTCQLVVSVVQLKPVCIKDFTEHNFKDVLPESLKVLSNLDNCLMLFSVDDHRQVKKTDKPLVSLVKQTQELFDKAQKPGMLA